MPERLNKEDMNYAKGLLEESGPSAMYDYFSSKGYNYATLANGVITGNSLAGAAAFSLFKFVNLHLLLSKVLLDVTRYKLSGVVPS